MWVDSASRLSAYITWILNHFSQMLSSQDLGVLFNFLNKNPHSSSWWLSRWVEEAKDVAKYAFSESNPFYDAKKACPHFSPVDTALLEIQKMINICDAEFTADAKTGRTESVAINTDFGTQEKDFVSNLY